MPSGGHAQHDRPLPILLPQLTFNSRQQAKTQSKKRSIIFKATLFNSKINNICMKLIASRTRKTTTRTIKRRIKPNQKSIENKVEEPEIPKIPPKNEPFKIPPNNNPEPQIKKVEEPRISAYKTSRFLDTVVSYIKTDRAYAEFPNNKPPVELYNKQIPNDTTFDARMYEHFEGGQPIQLNEREQLVLWRSLRPALTSFYERTHKYQYDLTRINLAEEVRLG